jgi:ubiquinone/menaquinone biosynthesis C-methylase UbiE
MLTRCNPMGLGRSGERVLNTANRPALLREGHRVLKPGGQLRFLEHVASESAGLRRTQKVLDATVWPTLGAGCHCARDTAAAIESAGFTIEDLERMRFPEMRLALPTSPHILGRARRR